MNIFCVKIYFGAGGGSGGINAFRIADGLCARRGVHRATGMRADRVGYAVTLEKYPLYERIQASISAKKWRPAPNPNGVHSEGCSPLEPYRRPAKMSSEWPARGTGLQALDPVDPLSSVGGERGGAFLDHVPNHLAIVGTPLGQRLPGFAGPLLHTGASAPAVVLRRHGDR